MGRYHWALVSLNTITARLTETNIKTLKALASLAILTTSKKRMAKAITTAVTMIEKTGVKYCLLIDVNTVGKAPSRAIAKGKREEASKPELAIERSVITPTTPAI